MEFVAIRSDHCSLFRMKISALDLVAAQNVDNIVQWKTFCHGFIGTLWLFLSSLFVQRFDSSKTFSYLKEERHNLSSSCAEAATAICNHYFALRSRAFQVFEVSDEHGGSIVASASVQHKQERDHRKGR